MGADALFPFVTGVRFLWNLVLGGRLCQAHRDRHFDQGWYGRHPESDHRKDCDQVPELIGRSRRVERRVDRRGLRGG